MSDISVVPNVVSPVFNLLLTSDHKNRTLFNGHEYVGCKRFLCFPNFKLPHDMLHKKAEQCRSNQKCETIDSLERLNGPEYCKADYRYTQRLVI